jgi:hypothetical protein
MGEKFTIAMELVAITGAVATFVYALGLLETVSLLAMLVLFVFAQVIKAR